jgi:hypothetical protein
MKTTSLNTLENQLINPSASTKIAYTSFIIGTLLLVSELIFQTKDIILFTGLIYVLIAILVNSITFLLLIYQLITNAPERFETFIQIGILLVNIPIAGLYFYLLIINPIH